MADATVLVINPGSTTTRVAVFRGPRELVSRQVAVPREEVATLRRAIDQVPLRTRHVRDVLASLPPGVRIDAIAARGGPLRPIPGGVYRVNKAMLVDAAGPEFVEHPSRTACLVANVLAEESGIPAFVVDPISTDEFDPISRISGLPSLPRRQLTHALNMKAVARRHAAATGQPYASLNLITAHLGGGISIAVHAGGRMVDSVDANGEGPMSPERTGGLRSDDLARWAKLDPRDAPALRRVLSREGGLVGHLGTGSGQEIERRIGHGDREAELVFRGLAYQISKHILALAAATNGRVDAILLTGGLAHSALLTSWIRERVAFLAPVSILPGECEMEALAEGVQRVLAGQERERIYWTGAFA